MAMGLAAHQPPTVGLIAPASLHEEQACPHTGPPPPPRRTALPLPLPLPLSRVHRPRGRRNHHLGLVGLVAAGGVVGTSASYATTLWLGTAGSGLPTATLAVNLVGCFLLGLLLEALGRRGPETTRMQRARLTLGTGVVGGFTTFSSLAEELALLVHEHAGGIAVLYAAVSVIGGLVATVLGITLAAGHHRLTSSDLPEDPDAEEVPAVPDRDTLEADTGTRGEQR